MAFNDGGYSRSTLIPKFTQLADSPLMPLVIQKLTKTGFKEGRFKVSVKDLNILISLLLVQFKWFVR